MNGHSTIKYEDANSLNQPSGSAFDSNHLIPVLTMEEMDPSLGAALSCFVARISLHVTDSLHSWRISRNI